MNENLFSSLSRMYEQRPDLFSDEDVYNLEQASMRFGRRFVRAEEAAPFNFFRTVSQLVTGFASGFTTLKIGDEPRNAMEAVSGSLGHLLGFIGFIPNPASIAAKFGVRTIAKITLKESASLGWRVKSVPMHVADRAMNVLDKATRGGAGMKARQFLNADPVMADVLHAGTHLGIASAFASAQPWELEIEDRMQGFVHGGLFGAGSRYLGNLMSTGGKLDVAKAIKQGDLHPIDFRMKQDEANMFARMLTSSGILGGWSTLRGDPIEMQLYEYLTGAYFGKVEMSIHKRKALQFASPHLQSEIGRTRLVSPEKLPGWKDLSRESQSEVRMISETQLAAEGTRFAMFDSIKQGQEHYRKQHREGRIDDAQMEKLEKSAEQFRLVEDLIDGGMPMGKAMEVGRREIIKQRKEQVDLMDFLFRGETGESLNVNTTAVEKLINEQHAILARYDDLKVSISTRTTILDTVNKVRGEKDHAEVELDVLNLFHANLREARNPDIKNREPHWDTLVERFKHRYQLDLETDPELYRGFRKAWVDGTQSEPIRNAVLSDTKDGIKVVDSGNYDLLNNLILQTGSKSYADKTIGNLVRLDKHRRESKEGALYDSPLYDSKDIWAWLPRRLYKENMFFISGIKDKEKMVAREFLLDRVEFEQHWHPDKPNSIMQRVWKLRPDLKEEFEAGIKDYLPKRDAEHPLTKDEIRSLRLEYAHLQANMMRVLEKLNNMPIEDIFRKETGHILTNVADLTKRWQVLDAHEVRLDADFFAKQGFDRKGLRTEVINATAKDIANFFNKENYHYFFGGRDGKRIKMWADAMRDGGDFIRQDVFDAMLKYYGEDPQAGFIKGTLSYSGPDGLVIGKHGNFRAPDALNEWMMKSNRDAIRFNTSIKQRGTLKLNDFYVDESFNILLKNKKGETLDLSTSEPHITPWDGITMLNAEHIKGSTQNIKMPVQVTKNIDDPRVLDTVWERYFEPVYRGDKVVNDNYNQYKLLLDKGTSEADLRAAAEKIDVHKLGIQEIMDIAGIGRDNRIPKHPLYSRFVREILSRGKNEDFWRDDGIVSEDSEALRQYVQDNTRTVDKLLNVVGDVSPAMAMGNPTIRKYLNVVLRNYVTDKMTRPQVDGAWYAYLNPIDPITEAKYRVSENMFMAPESMRTHRVPFQGKMTELGKIQDKFRALVYERFPQEWQKREWRDVWEEFYRQVDGGEKKVTENLREYMDALDMVVVRVPQDSQSGARVLRFFDFAEGSRGAGVLVHPKNSANMGGADKDGDKAFVLPGLPREMKDYYRKYTNQWEKDGVRIPEKTSMELLESSPAAWERSLRHFDPASVIRASMASVENNRQLGPGLNAVNRWKTLWPDISGKWVRGKIDREKGLRLIESINKARKKTGEPLLSEELAGNMWWSGLGAKSSDRLWRLSRDVVNLSADASTSGQMKSRSEVRNILGRAAFDKFHLSFVDPATAKSKKPKFINLEVAPEKLGPDSYEPYKALMQVDRLRKGRSDSGKAISAYEMMVGLKDLHLKQQITPGAQERSAWYRGGERLAELQVHLNLEAFIGKEFQKVLSETEKFVKDLGGKRTPDEDIVYQSILRRHTKWGDFQAFLRTDFYRLLSPTEKHNTVMDFMWKDGVDVASIRSLTSLGRSMTPEHRNRLVDIGGRVEEFKRRYRFVGENIRAQREATGERISAEHGTGDRTVDSYNHIRQDYKQWWDGVISKQPEAVQRWTAYHTLSTLSVHPETFQTFAKRKFSNDAENPFVRWGKLSKLMDMEGARRAKVLKVLEGHKYEKPAKEIAKQLTELEREYYGTKFSGMAWTLDILPPKYIKGFAQEIDKVFDVTFKDTITEADKKKIQAAASPDDVSGSIKKIVQKDTGNKANIRFHSDNYIQEKTNSSFEKLAKEFEGRSFKRYIEKQPESVKKELRDLRSKLYRIFKNYPHIMENFPDIFASQLQLNRKSGLGVAPEGATLQDVRHFVNTVDWALSKPSAKSYPLKKHHWFMPPEYLGRGEMQKYDHNVEKLKMFVVTGRDSIERREVKTLLTSMEKIRLMANNVHHFKDTAIQEISWHYNHQNEVLETVKALSKVEKGLGEKLHEIAISLKESPLGEKDTNARTLYETAFKKAQADLEPHLDKTITVDIGGKKLSMKGRDWPEYLSSLVSRWAGGRAWNVVDNPEVESKILVKLPARSTEGKDISMIDPEASMKRLTDMLLNNETFTPPWNTIARLTWETRIQNMKFNLGDNTFIVLSEIKDPVRRAQTYDMLKEMRTINLDGKPAYRFPFLREGSPWIIEPFLGGRHDQFYPHMDMPKRAVQEYLERRLQEMIAKNAPADEIAKLEILLKGKVESLDALVSMDQQHMLNFIMNQKVTPEDFQKSGMFTKPDHAQWRSRTDPVPDWSKNPEVMEKYETRMVESTWRVLGALLSHREVARVQKDGVFGKNTKHWIAFMETFIRNNAGYPTIFPQEWLADKGYAIAGNPYHFFTDDYLASKYVKFFGTAKDALPEDMGKRKKAAAIDGLEHIEKMWVANKLQWFSALEAKYSVLTLLSHTKSMMNNLVGSTSYEVMYSGLHHYRNSWNKDRLATIRPEWRDTKNLMRDVAQLGGIEGFFRGDLSIIGEAQRPKMRAFASELTEVMKKNPELKNFSPSDLAKKHGVYEFFINAGAWPMRMSERHIRTRSWLTHYLKFREVLEASNVQFEWNDPIIVGMANRGVAATQFLYHSAARPQFMATSFGKMFTRFKQFALRSVTMRAEVARMAKLTGYNPNTPEYKALERYMVGDLFVMSMASLFPYTVFEAVLAPPWDWFADLSAFLFGSKWEKDQAFWGTLPYPLNITQPLHPPSGRILTGMFNVLLTGDWERLMSREVHTWFPFGRMTNSVVRSMNAPQNTIRNLTGFPVYLP